MVYINSVKVCAIFIVILLHASGPLVLKLELGSVGWWISHFYDSISRWGVPVFIMVSGALLLPKDETLTSFYVKRFRRLVAPVIFWSIFFSIWFVLRETIKGKEVVYSDIFYNILSGLPHYHMWYLYMLIGLFMFLPFIRIIVNRFSFNELLLLTCLMLALSAGNWFYEYFYGTRSKIFLTWFLSYLPFVFIGYLISISNKVVNVHLLTLVFVLSVLATLFGTNFALLNFESSVGFYLYTNLSVSVIPMSISVFYIFKSLSSKLPDFNLLSNVSSLTLGIYLVHPVFLEVIYYFIPLSEGWYLLFVIPFISLLVFAVSYLFCHVMARLPYLNRVV